MKIDISKKYLRKVNHIEICSTMTSQDISVRAFTGSKYHVLVDAIGGRHYFNPFYKSLSNENNDFTVSIAFVGGVDSGEKITDNRNDMQKISLVNAVKEVVYWMYCERLDLSLLTICGKNIAFDARKEYAPIIVSEGYKVEALY